MGKGRDNSEADKMMDSLAGGMKEAAGVVSGDRTLEAEGRSDQRRSDRKTYQVKARKNGDWEVRAASSSRASNVYRTKDEATSKVRELAKNNRPSQILIYKTDGTVETEQTYD